MVEKALLNGAAVILATHDAGIRRMGQQELLTEEGFDILRRCVSKDALIEAGQGLLTSEHVWTGDDREKMVAYLKQLQGGA